LLAIQRRVDKLKNIPESQTSSLATSDEVIEGVEGNWEELLMNWRKKL